MKTLSHLSLLLFLFGFIVATNSGCQDCASEDGGQFYREAMGTWRLVRIVSPTKTQTVFPIKQILRVHMGKGSTGYGMLKEARLNDTTTVASSEWSTLDPDCRNSAFTVFYGPALQRKYWPHISKSGRSLRATGYVDQIGSKADTLMYYYEPEL